MINDRDNSQATESLHVTSGKTGKISVHNIRKSITVAYLRDEDNDKANKKRKGGSGNTCVIILDGTS